MKILCTQLSLIVLLVQGNASAAVDGVDFPRKTTLLQQVPEGFGPLGFLPPLEVYPKCMKIMSGVGAHTGDLKLAQSVCEKVVGSKGAGEGPESCLALGTQMEMITSQGFWKGGNHLCSQVVQFHSYMSKTDCLKYIPERDLDTACGDAISRAVEMAAGATGPVDAVRANLPVACKQDMESRFQANGLPLPPASTACEQFLPKADQGLQSGELDPTDAGRTFCLGQSISGLPFIASQPSLMPQGFPLTKSDWKPKITLAHLHDMVVQAHRTGNAGFNFFDTNKDGKIDDAEWKVMCETLQIPTMDCENLKMLMDTSKSGTIDNKEWQQALGVSLPELVIYNSDKHGNAAKGWKAADADGDGSVTEEEFDAFCVGLGVLPGIAKPNFSKVDTDGDGSINEEEFRNAFGVDLPELRKRARAKWGPPSKSFPAIDANKDGKMQPEEFLAAAKAMNIPEERAKELMKQLDANGDGVIDPQEWDGAMSLGGKEIKQEVNKALGPDPMKQLDADGDGQVDAEEMKKGLAKAGLSPEEADELLKNMDKDGDGKLNKQELEAGLSGKAPAAAEAAAAAGAPPKEVAKQLLKDRFASPKEAFKAADKDGDGNLSKDEMKEALMASGASPLQAEQAMQDMDKNGDGQVDPEEFYDAMGSPQKFDKGWGPLEIAKKKVKDRFASPKDAFDKMDKDKDGKLTPAELRAGLVESGMNPEQVEKAIKLMDNDPSDGSVSRKEFYAVMGSSEEFSANPGEAGFPKKSKEAAAIADAGAPPKEVAKQILKEKFASPKEALETMDADGDGQLSPEEIKEKLLASGVSPEEADAMIKDMDKNGDGVIGSDEFYDAVGPPEKFDKTWGVLEIAKGVLKQNFASPKMAFDALDKNGDGSLSPEELKQGLISAGMRPDLAEKAMAEFDTDGDGKCSSEEFYKVMGAPEEFTASPGDKGYVEPIVAEEAKVPLPEVVDRLRKAFGSCKGAWEAIAGKGATSMTPEQWKKTAADLGIPPGEAKKRFAEIDTDGDGKISEAELQEAMGVTFEEVKDLFLDEFGNADKALEGTDTDGDGKVTEKELLAVMQKKLGLSPAAAAKAAKMVMRRLDPDGNGSIPGQEFKTAILATAEDLAERVIEKYGSAPKGFEAFDKDGDGKVTEDEFIAGALDLGVSPAAAKAIWKQHGKPGDGVMDLKEFVAIFGIGPDQIMERAFQHFGNPTKAFVAMDTNEDGLLSPEEWKVGATKMGLGPAQVKRLFKDMDVNHKEHTQGFISHWEWNQFLDFEDPQEVTWNDGYGDIDPFGKDHKKFNVLPHKHDKKATSLSQASGHKNLRTF